MGYLDVVGIAKLEELWAELRATVEGGASRKAVFSPIFSAWQIISEFILVNIISIINAASWWINFQTHSPGLVSEISVALATSGSPSVEENSVEEEDSEDELPELID